jgi:metallophosphoesterase (TIGR00282 family)
MDGFPGADRNAFMMKLVLLGDVVGRPGRHALSQILPSFRRNHGIDFCIANAENAAGGRGITRGVCKELRAAGVDVITLGDHAWDQDEAQDLVTTEADVLRPGNGQRSLPGRGWNVYRGPGGTAIAVVNVIGRVFMPPLYGCPFEYMDEVLHELMEADVRVIVVDIHAEATSEKIAMGYHLNGRVSAVFGTHTHVQTADEKVLSNGTAYITDLGMCGPMDSVLGREVDAVLRKFLSGLPTRMPVAKEDVRVQGAIVELNERTGRAETIRRVQERDLTGSW